MQRYRPLCEGFTKLDSEKLRDLISRLKDGSFSNLNDRVEFLKLILPLALSTDKRARKIVKAMGDMMTDLGEILLQDLDKEGENEGV